MVLAVQQIAPIAHLPLLLGVVRRLAVATVMDPPHLAAPGACAVDWVWSRSPGSGAFGRASCPL
jgi:hypothetical protein